MICRFMIAGPPVTKKNHGQIFTITPKGGGRPFHKIMPSEQYEEWFGAALQQGITIRAQLERHGVKLPIAGPVAIRMLFYRKQASGDLGNFEAAVLDAIQRPMFRFECPKCKKKQNSTTPMMPECRHCRCKLPPGKVARKGIGIIDDDKNVQSKDGSRMFVDKLRPRVEIEISAFSEFPVQVGLELHEEEF